MRGRVTLYHQWMESRRRFIKSAVAAIAGVAFVLRNPSEVTAASYSGVKIPLSPITPGLAQQEAENEPNTSMWRMIASTADKVKLGSVGDTRLVAMPFTDTENGNLKSVLVGHFVVVGASTPSGKQFLWVPVSPHQVFGYGWTYPQIEADVRRWAF